MDRLFVRLALYVVRFAGAVAGVWGVAYAVNGATQAGGEMVVRVLPRFEAAERLGLSGVKLPRGLSLGGGELSLRVWDSTAAEQVLFRADVLVGGLCALVAALLVGGLLTSVFEGEPYRRGNAARVAWLAVLALVSGAAQALPALAVAAVLDRAGAGGTFGPPSGLSWLPFTGAALLAALALALRAGGRARADVTSVP
ncbi:hypothetical protein ACIBK9_20225 [Nonomuraea sp. NPDC050227]|uniref:hypothetical protein n=1 Tax=Nonomuraea sp. NPDC050227 TaxID=3364360 RepID=UPI0037B8DB90